MIVWVGETGFIVILSQKTAYFGPLKPPAENLKPPKCCTFFVKPPNGGHFSWNLMVLFCETTLVSQKRTRAYTTCKNFKKKLKKANLHQIDQNWLATFLKYFRQTTKLPQKTYNLQKNGKKVLKMCKLLQIILAQNQEM